MTTYHALLLREIAMECPGEARRAVLEMLSRKEGEYRRGIETEELYTSYMYFHCNAAAIGVVMPPYESWKNTDIHNAIVRCITALRRYFEVFLQ